ncbi:hypothetical protein GCM10027277_47020 [Pseudoduganella ginsengisoli]
MLVLAACGGDQSTPASKQGGAPRAMQGAPVRQGDAPAFITFSGNASQYTVVANASGFAVTDIVTGQSTQVAAGSRLRFADSAIALDIQGNAALVYRIYQAAFNRKPDLPGLGFWIAQMDNGVAQRDVAANFITSEEFALRYGANPTNLDYVTKLYNNILQRAPEKAGLDYWLDVLNRGATNRVDVLGYFSESEENKGLVAPAIANGIEYLPWGSSLPSKPVADYVAQYNGSLSGGDTGNLTIIVNSSGVVQAGGHINGPNVDVGGSAQLAASGRFEMDYGGNGQALTLKGSINAATGVATGTWANAAAKTSGVFVASKPVPQQPKLFPQVQAIITQRCVGCHSAHTTFPGYNTAQAGISFDTEAQIRAQAALIKSEAVDTQRMPFGNATGMTQAERNTLAAWFAAGTPQ